MRTVIAVIATIGLCACTRPNPAYCDVTSDCAVGVCTEHHTCVDLDGAPSDGPTADAAGDARPACDERIAFLTDREGVLQIYSMNPDGTDQVNISMTSVDETFAGGGELVWSPDGARIAYVRPMGTVMWAIWVMNADGSAHHALTNGHLDLNPTWDADGARLAFSRATSLAAPSNIWVLDVAGGGPTQVSTGGRDLQPDWSPDGSKIAFSSGRSGDTELYVVNPDGTGELPLTTNTSADGPPKWSRDAASFAFLSNRAGGNVDVWKCGSTGAGPVNLTASSPAEDDPVWFPDGSRIAFVRTNASSAHDIYVMNADGSGQTPLEMLATDDASPSVSPDGTRVVWQSMRDGNWEIYRANSDGTGVRRLTTDAGADTIPAWRRCP